MRKAIVLVLAPAIFVIGAAAVPASADVVIDFESLATGEIADNQFLGLGVDFNGLGSILNLNPSFPPVSGVNVLFDDPALSGGGLLRMDAVGTSWSMAGGFVTGFASITLDAFDSGGALIDSASTPGANFIGVGNGLFPNIFVSVSAPNIAYVEFSDSGSSYTIDDFTFRQTVIPVPGAVLLGALGMGMVGWVRKRVV